MMDGMMAVEKSDRDDASPDQDPAAVAADIVKRSGTSFYWAMRLLAPAKRRATYAIYAFCREVDDIVDGPDDPPTKRARLAEWRVEIDRLQAGRPAGTVGRALLGPVQGFGLARDDFLAVIEGMEIDAAETVRFRDMAELEIYCDRVAGAVGRLCNRVFGIDDEAATPLAKCLGEALQLTNILRDVGEDARRDRVYLPADLLARHGIANGDAMAMLTHPALPDACREIAGIAEERFVESGVILQDQEPHLTRPARMMKAVYHRLLGRIEEGGWRQPERRVSLTKFEKIRVSVGALLSRS